MHIQSFEGSKKELGAIDVLPPNASAALIQSYANLTTLGLKNAYENDTPLHGSIRHLLHDELISAEQAVEWLRLATRLCVEDILMSQITDPTRFEEIEMQFKRLNIVLERTSLITQITSLRTDAELGKEAA